MNLLKADIPDECYELIDKMIKLFARDDMVTKNASKNLLKGRMTVDDYAVVINRQYDMMAGCS